MSVLCASGVEAFASISLEELIERAELLTRVDRKYVVDAREAEAIMERLTDTARVLEVGSRRSFAYRSSYFDTPERDSFFSAGRSRRRRWKVRTRTYLDSETTWLEIKTRSAREQTMKQRIAYADADSGGLTAVGQAYLAAVLGDRIAASVVPVLDTDYRRTTLFLPASNSRATVDVDLRWTSLINRTELARPTLVVIETKTGSTPSAVDRLMWSRGHRPVRVSKFGVGMAALDPDLPRLKWHHAMGRHFGLPHHHPSTRSSS